jgi:hypothetical protein
LLSAFGGFKSLSIAIYLSDFSISGLFLIKLEKTYKNLNAFVKPSHSVERNTIPNIFCLVVSVRYIYSLKEKTPLDYDE